MQNNTILTPKNARLTMITKHFSLKDNCPSNTSSERRIDGIIPQIDRYKFFEDLFYALNRYDRFYAFEIKNEAAKSLLNQVSFSSLKTAILVAGEIIKAFNTACKTHRIAFVRLNKSKANKNYYTLIKVQNEAL